jgi:hypothetical protein
MDLTCSSAFTNVVKTYGIFYSFAEAQQKALDMGLKGEENEFLGLRCDV